MPLLTHVITGFLGAGKTTLITALLARRPAGERWAILVNEFGQIGIDQVAWAGQDVLIKEVPGGCICCAQSLPMQIALGQIVSRVDCDRLIIEPTGLGHPAQILETLREPHWQSSLQLGATLCLVDARQLGDPRVMAHETFRAQVEVADVLLFSKADLLSAAERELAEAFAGGLQPAKALVAFATPETVDSTWLETTPRAPVRRRRSLLHLAPAQTAGAAPPIREPVEPPYHYHEEALGHWVGGWILPAAWQFRHDELLSVLMSWRGMERLKAVFHTDKGWIFFNASALELAIRSSEYRADSRVELISAQPLDWGGHEQALLATLVPAE